MLGLVNDWVGMWMGHVLQWVWLQGRYPLAVVGDWGGGFGRSWDSLNENRDLIATKLNIVGR